MSQRYKVNTLVLSGKDISVDNNDITNYLRHDGTFQNPIAGIPTSGNLQSTGIALTNTISLVSGNLITTGQTLYSYVIGLSGIVTGNYINLQATGSNLYNLINNFSGVFNASGVQYQTQINTLATNLQSTGVSLKSSLDLISGNLITTGVNLGSKIDSLSGWVNNTSRVSAINVTGFGNQTGVINFSGKGSVTVFTGDGNFIYISGSPSASSDHGDGVNLSGNLTTTGQTLYGYISSLSGTFNSTPKVTGISVTGFVGQTGLINISGAGNVTVITGINNFIYISGTASASSDTASNLGVGYGIFSQKSAGDFKFLSITGTTGAVVVQSGNTLLIGSTAVGGGGGFNPSGSGSYIFRTAINNGVSSQFIFFPSFLNQSPRVVASIHNNYDNTVIPVQISGAVNSGFWAVFPNTIPNTGYFIDVFGATSDTGLASTVITITNNNSYAITGTLVSITGSSYLSGYKLTGIGSAFLSLNNYTLTLSGSGEANTVSNQGVGYGLFSQKIGTDLQFNSITGGSGVAVSKSGSNYLISSTVPMCIPFSTASVTLTNMAAALDFFNSSNVSSITYADLSPYSQIQLISRVGTVGTTTGWLSVGYLGNFSTTASNYLTIDANSTKTMFGAAGVTNSGWQPLVAGAKSGVYLALTQIGGNGTLDPVFGGIYAFFK